MHLCRCWEVPKCIMGFSKSRRRHHQRLQKLVIWTNVVKGQHHPLWLLISSAFLYVLSSLSSCEAGFMHCQSFPGCHVDGGWGQWAAWTQCSLSCGTGLQSRRRSCDNPAAQGSGRGCVGAAEQTKDCNTQTCKGTHDELKPRLWFRLWKPASTVDQISSWHVW